MNTRGAGLDQYGERPVFKPVLTQPVTSFALKASLRPTAKTVPPSVRLAVAKQVEERERLRGQLADALNRFADDELSVTESGTEQIGKIRYMRRKALLVDAHQSLSYSETGSRRDVNRCNCLAATG